MGNTLVTSNASLGTELSPATFETKGGSRPSKVISLQWILALQLDVAPENQIFVVHITVIIFLLKSSSIFFKDRMAQTTYLLLGRQLKLSVLTKELAMIGQQLIEAWGKAAF